MVKVLDISVEAIKNNQFLKELPELFELKNYIENNGWHNHDSVFDHTLAVVEELERLLNNTNDAINSYLNQKVDTCTKRELLILGALFHDIAKSDVLISDGEFTFCPKHEEVGCEKVKRILQRFDLSDYEKSIVANIVKFHGEIHGMLNPRNEKLHEQYVAFKSDRHDIYTELFLLAMADTLGSQLKENNPDDFAFRIDFYQNLIDQYEGA